MSSYRVSLTEVEIEVITLVLKSSFVVSELFLQGSEKDLRLFQGTVSKTLAKFSELT